MSASRGKKNVDVGFVDAIKKMTQKMHKMGVDKGEKIMKKQRRTQLFLAFHTCKTCQQAPKNSCKLWGEREMVKVA